MAKYVCSVCGYVYDPAVGDPDNGGESGNPFEKLPGDWVCPCAGLERTSFERKADSFSPTCDHFTLCPYRSFPYSYLGRRDP